MAAPRALPTSTTWLSGKAPALRPKLALFSSPSSELVVRSGAPHSHQATDIIIISMSRRAERLAARLAQVYPIDLESPTSTLPSRRWRLQGKAAMRSNSNGSASGKRASRWKQSTHCKPEASSWLTESSAGAFAPGFTVKISLGEQQNSAEICVEPDNNAECGSCVDAEKANGEEEEEEEDENKDYWNSILNLVNSSSPPPVF
ncbi:hypothetical protein KSP40_PGU013011 [Platanthera guangdongensis]|uniref:Uncharacterized protein n=1 Tax=Platanthera guangdongensis TaxID=2320717 RepID=A0ABR2LRF4_9ASPA